MVMMPGEKRQSKPLVLYKQPEISHIGIDGLTRKRHDYAAVIKGVRGKKLGLYHNCWVAP